jgi:hypothetical protein
LIYAALLINEFFGDFSSQESVSFDEYLGSNIVENSNRCALPKSIVLDDVISAQTFDNAIVFAFGTLEKACIRRQLYR